MNRSNCIKVNTRDYATEYRLVQWAETMRRCQESGKSKKGFCDSEGIHPNVFFYWQRKLREAACETLISAQKQAMIEAEPMESNVPSGWSLCETLPESTDGEKEITIEINGFRVSVGADTDLELLKSICGMLRSIC